MALSSNPESLVLFDMDGVLVDSRDAIARSVNHALEAEGFAPHPEEIVHAHIGTPLEAIFVALLGDAGRDRPLVLRLIEAYRRRYAVHAADETRVFPGMPEAVADLARDHRVAVATTKPGEIARPLLDRLGLLDAFEVVVGACLHADRIESKTVTVGRALEALGASPGRTRGVMVGDRHHDVLAGRAHGLDTLGVTWGAGTVAELEEAGVHCLVNAPAGLAPAARGRLR